VGSGDLRLSLAGSVVPDNGQELMEEALLAILSSCREHNLVAGIFCTSIAESVEMIRKGFRFITLKSDSMILSEHATRLVSELRTILPADTSKLE
jgi:4-hydroxy-2-oxoheptanedioate aldolase